MRVEIDGISCEARRGEYLLEVARRNGIDIPTLCHHDALPGQACCRLCLAEVTDGAGRTRLVTSCVFPVEEGQRAATNTEKIRRLRRNLLTILRERAPGARGLEALCAAYGAADLGGRFHRDPAERCILCGLCTRACASLGSCAIAAAHRGVDKEVTTPLGQPSPACIGCGACAGVCPTGAIPVEESGGVRRIWGREFRLLACAGCGAPYATPEQVQWLERTAGLEDRGLCARCRRRAGAAAFV